MEQGYVQETGIPGLVTLNLRVEEDQQGWFLEGWHADRLAEQVKKREQREVELSAALKPALLRIAELSRELEQTRIQLAKAEIELGDLRRGGPGR